MTRSELVERLTEALEDAQDLEQPLGAREVEKAVKQILEYMSSALERGDRIELRGFGSFSLHTRTAGTARNPRTGERVRVGVRYVPHFKPGKALRERVDNARSKMP